MRSILDNVEPQYIHSITDREVACKGVGSKQIHAGIAEVYDALLFGVNDFSLPKILYAVVPEAPEPILNGALDVIGSVYLRWKGPLIKVAFIQGSDLSRSVVFKENDGVVFQIDRILHSRRDNDLFDLVPLTGYRGDLKDRICRKKMTKTERRLWKVEPIHIPKDLQRYPHDKTKNTGFPEMFCNIAITGSAYRKCIVFSPNAKTDEKWLAVGRKHKDKILFKTELSNEVLNEVVNLQRNLFESDVDDTLLLCFDDYGTGVKFRNDYGAALDSLATKYRWAGISVIGAYHGFKQLSPICRAQISHYFLFRMSDAEVKKIYFVTYLQMMFDNYWNGTDRLTKEGMDAMITNLSQDKLWSDLPPQLREEMFTKLRREVCVDILQKHLDDVAEKKAPAARRTRAVKEAE
ncbi:uncharacterized protein EV422DRAFT_506271 [Fimicolochytrium jonesii]|uniref:uncharacterized protein n=1 Tax=Fimicolochytrium jonesii TaxID=1396493 RepID=UPI0022FF3C40|nr:uncharacterized protein EV422DRAFT_506271 [Fimicolochytrium jonesii]KAI8821054.1 hypothetical protein EV422DRAFT_506271 [Fimicolochytrium jonesii]